jgi:predicted ATP-dependent protease
MLAHIAPTLPVPPDRAYVQRFGDPDRPRLLTLAPGTAARLAAELDEVREALAQRIPTLLEDRALEQAREELRASYGAEDARGLTELRGAIEAEGLALVAVEEGGTSHPDVAPVRDGKPVPMEEAAAGRTEAEVSALRERLELRREDVREYRRAQRTRQRAFGRELRALVAEAAGAMVDEELRDVAELFPQEDVAAFLADVRTDAVAAVEELAAQGPPALERLPARLDRYRVNVVADRTGLAGAPVVEERFPTRQNVAGSVERVQEGPFAWRADASTVHGGALLRADGGFLVLSAHDLLAEPGAWDAVKRTIKHGVLEIGAGGPAGPGQPRAVEPDPVPLDVKIVLIGERAVHDRLYAADPDVRKLFAIRADFAADTPRTPSALRRYAEVVAGIVAREGLPAVTADGLGALVEEGVALAGRRDRITARFAEVANLVREAAFRARRRGAQAIERVDVEDARRAREERDGQTEERLQGMLEEGSLLVATSGRRVGQVNGLSVYDLGYHAFGKPTRITASAAPGRAGIINVEREARLSGGVYDKGVLIISGYLRRRYADLGSLSLTASLAFEQSYAGVDGDSASIAEVVALLSEISGLPVDQGIAVTGSINQHGEVQPVGGVTHKLRGFHALARARGLDGSHGVVLPVQNVRDLMLPPELVADAAAGRFHVFAVARVEDALELALDAPMDEIDRRVRARLHDFARALSEAPLGGDLAPTAAAVPPPTTPLPEQPGAAYWPES